MEGEQEDKPASCILYRIGKSYRSPPETAAAQEEAATVRFQIIIAPSTPATKSLINTIKKNRYDILLFTMAVTVILSPKLHGGAKHLYYSP